MRRQPEFKGSRGTPLQASEPYKVGEGPWDLRLVWVQGTGWAAFMVDLLGIPNPGHQLLPLTSGETLKDFCLLSLCSLVPFSSCLYWGQSAPLAPGDLGSKTGQATGQMCLGSDALWPWPAMTTRWPG